MEEIWKDIIGHEGFYQVSNFGKVRSLDRKIYRIIHNVLTEVNYKGKNITPYITKHPYYRINLQKNTKQKKIYVHRLMMDAFFPNDNPKRQVNHKDGNKLNNILDNLEWSDPIHNAIHAHQLNLNKQHGEGHFFHKLKEKDIINIRNMYLSGDFTQEKLSIIFNVSESNIRQIVNKLTWKHIK